MKEKPVSKLYWKLLKSKSGLISFAKLAISCLSTKFKILMNKDGTPKGGKWSFDEDNRKKLPDKVDVPKQLKFQNTSHTEILKKFIELNFKNHPGTTNNFWFPTTREQTQKLFDQFIKSKIDLFGDYEDAVSKKSNILFQSTFFVQSNVIN